MMKIGLTGGIGSGKSLVAKIFAHLGIPIYVADIEAKRIMVQDDEVKSAIINLLGSRAYTDGHLDRLWIAQRVFSDPSLLASLDAIVHPAVHRDFLSWSDRQVTPYVIEEAAILLKSGGFRVMDRVVSVYAPEDIRIKRVMDRDGVSKEQVCARIARQLHPQFVLSMSDHVIFNDGSRPLVPQVMCLHEAWVREVQLVH